MKKVIFILAVFAIITIILNCGGDDVVNVPNDIRVVLYPDTVVSAFYNDTVDFRAYVWNTTDTTVRWYVNNIENGNSTIGTIDSAGHYIAPDAAADFDEVTVKVISLADSTKFDTSLVYILDRNFIFVDADSGDDLTGKGTLVNPFRTITKGISRALNGQIIRPAAGVYNAALGEIFPLIPTRDVTVQGHGNSLTFVEPPDDQPAFNLQYERATIKDLAIRRSTKTGIGVEYAGLEGLGRLIVNSVAIANCRIAALKSGFADSIEFINSTVDSCVYGVVVQEPGLYLNLDLSSFTNIDSIAVETISPITGTLNFNIVTVDNAWIGLNLVQESFALIHESIFANIESTAVYLNSNAALNVNVLPGHNDFSGCSNWCIINNTADTIQAQNNTWPSTDTLIIDSQYIYDNDEDPSKGPVLIVPIR